jgi:oxygen-independent coproporphyrinogen-3 oxidase
MLLAAPELKGKGMDGVRFATPDSLEAYSGAASQLDPAEARRQQLRASRILIDTEAALEESFFLGLRMNRGIARDEINNRFGSGALDGQRPVIAELIADGLLENVGNRLRLTPPGRLLSNEVFARFLRDQVVHRGPKPGNGPAKFP